METNEFNDGGLGVNAEPEKKTRAKSAEREPKDADDFDTAKYFDEHYFDAPVTREFDKSNREVMGEFKKNVFKPNYSSNRIRCKIRTAQRYNVTIEHLENAATTLNNRVIDGFLANDLIGRTGFYDGVVINRADLATRLKTTPRAIEIADSKLASIIKKEDVLSAYSMVTSLKLNDMQQKVIANVAFGGEN
jgi:ribosomal protein L25 (general stress protein Ctc)